MPRQKRIDLSVVVAAYDEEPVIAGNMKKIVDELSSRPEIKWELICVDDGSKDRTGSFMDEFLKNHPEHVKVLHHRRNFGQGRALRTAFDISLGEIIITLDADLSYGPEYIYRLMDALKDGDVEICLASPYTKGGSVRNVPGYRSFLSRWGNRYLARMSQYDISTSTCVVRSYRREVIDMISLSSDGMELQLEILMKASMMKFKVCEIPADLVWEEEKLAKADFKRVSKMRILSTIKMYLMMGWLSSPAYIFILFGMLLLLPGLWMAGWRMLEVAGVIGGYISKGAGFESISLGISEVFTQNVYSFVISGTLIIIGLLVLIFSMLVMQNKFYFDELYRLGQQILKDRKQ